MSSHQPRDLRVLGITGPIGCGKSTVASITRGLGAVEVIDADQIVHQLMAAGTSLTAKIRYAFGAEVIAPNGSVDRRHLGTIVFGDAMALSKLEALVHPEVRNFVFEQVEDHKRSGRNGVVVIEAIKLLQSPVGELVDSTWVVTCGQEEQRSRLMTQRGYTADEVGQRTASSPSFADAGYVINIINDGSLESLTERVRQAWLQETG